MQVKPIKLTMKGFMTFNEKTEINFSMLGASGLFLITGDTGAGKSTIFDAVSYALFGKVSGSLRSGLNPVSDFLSEGDDCFVELEFIHKNKVYTVKRNPDYMGRKARGKGFTSVSKNALLISEDDEVRGNRQVTAKITEILGVDRNQFKQIAMLAQGEFMELLNAGGSEREVILRKIFNTYIYEGFKNRLKKVRDDYQSQCAENDLKLVQSLKSADFDEKSVGFDNFNSWLEEGCNINKAKDVIALIDEMNKSDTQALSETKQEKQKADSNYKKAELELSRAQADNEIFNSRDKLEEERQALAKEKISADEKEKNLDLILRAKIVIPFYQNYIKEERTLKNIISETEKNEAFLKELKSNEENVKLNYERAAEQKPEIERLSAELLKENEALKDYDELEKLNQSLKKHNDERTDIEKKYKIIEDGIAMLSERLDSANENILKLKNTDADLIVVQNKYDNKTAYKNNLDELFKIFSKIKKDTKNTEKLEQDFIRAEKEYQTALKNYENARSVFLSGQAGIMAKNLKDGVECPVCGSVSHPQKAKLVGNIPSEEEINLLEKEKNDKDKLSRTKNNTLSKKKGELETIVNGFIHQMKELFKLDSEEDGFDIYGKILTDNIKLTEAEIKKLSEEVKKLKAELEAKNKLSEEIKRLEERIKDGKNQFEQIKKVKDDNEKLISELKIKINTKSEKLKFETKALALKSIEEKKSLKNALQKKLDESEKRYNNLNTDIQKTEAVLTENRRNKLSAEVNIENAGNKYNEKLKESKFLSDEEFLKASELQKQEDRLKKYLDDFKERELKNKISLEQINKNLEGKEFKNLDILKQSCKILLKEKNDIEEEFLRLYKKCDVNGRILEASSALLSSGERIRRKFLNADELYKTAGGNLTGKNRISIENYVQAFYFKRIIQQSNKRLALMTGGQYELLKKETTTKRSDEAFALDLVVYDYYTAKTRDVSSLSGGEAFKAALSLALGLSDVIQSQAGGIEIDAVFIDEGFGSLDSDSLEQAISVLCELSEGNRLVGIISHVNELKERISKKVVVKKTFNGSKAELDIS